eukprot:GHVN01003098.1.p1 GENE.GHVN01003098.1~~GHVN01003098.1.p1  ORF type:complete len:231 (+),score=22.70 GHVN01003098.1:835-1527(+)
MASAVRTPFHRACTWGSLTDFETRSVGSDFEVDNLNAEHAKATLLDLAEELRVTRRENVDKHILPSAQQWEEVLSRHLKVREEMLAETRRIYRQKYNPLTRRLSLESGCRKYYSDHVKPLKNQIALGRKLLAQAHDLRVKAATEAQRVEVRNAVGGSCVGVYNTHCGKVSWKNKTTGCLAGAYNPYRRTVQWRSVGIGSIAACWNPETQVSDISYPRRCHPYSVRGHEVI